VTFEVVATVDVTVDIIAETEPLIVEEAVVVRFQLHPITETGDFGIVLDT
jgi:hypothetical protein